MSAADQRAAVERIRSRERVTGYWITLDNPVGTERIARLGYDYVAFDMQHGLLAYSGLLHGLQAVDAAGVAAGMARVEANDAVWIGKALDAGAWGVIVPLVNSAEEAARAVAACRYPPNGIRSYGPMRSALRIGPAPRESDATVLCIAMIETGQALANVQEIAATPGLDGLYVGPSDLSLGIGAQTPGGHSGLPGWDEAIEAITKAAEANGIACGMHCPDGATAARAIELGFTFATVSGDLVHLETAARQHLDAARGA